MSNNTLLGSAVAFYEGVLKNGRKSRLPPHYPQPQPPAAWPPENVALLERYLAWLIADGAGVTCIRSYYLPMAGHVLGYNLKPHTHLNLDSDLDVALAFVQAKRPNPAWATMCGHALARFRTFVQRERGLLAPTVTFRPLSVARYHAGLPDWLISQLTHYQHLRQANWRPARLSQAIQRFWSSHTRFWRWLFCHYPIESIGDIQRQQLFAYLDERLAAGANPKTVNQELRAFQATLHFLRERDFVVPQPLLRLRGLKEPDCLPRFLTDEQIGRLQTDFEQRVQSASNPVKQRDALLDRAAFYLLWQGGLRLGEVEELTLADLHLTERQLLVRQGKGLKDRVVYLTNTATAALQAYLSVRGDAATDHLCLFRHQPLHKDFLRERLKAAGARCGLKVTPHQLRHTYATQLLNAGCKITTIQALLGHQHLNTTLIYARVHDHTVANDYFTAMALIEAKQTPPVAATQPNPGTPNSQLLTLLDGLHPLNAQQQAIINTLRQELLALAV